MGKGVNGCQWRLWALRRLKLNKILDAHSSSVEAEENSNTLEFKRKVSLLSSPKYFILSGDCYFNIIFIMIRISPDNGSIRNF